MGSITLLEMRATCWCPYSRHWRNATRSFSIDSPRSRSMDGLVVSSLGLPMSYTRVDLIWLAITRCNSDPAGGWVRTLVGPPSRALSKWHVGSRMSVLVSICLLTLVKQSNTALNQTRRHCRIPRPANANPGHDHGIPSDR